MPSTQESKVEEVKQTCELFAVAIGKTENNNAFDELLEKHELLRVLWVGAWIRRFLHNITTVHKQCHSGSSELNNKQIQEGNLKKTVYIWMCTETKREC